MNSYAATLDFTTLMDNLSKAGVPDEVITYVLSGGSATDQDTNEGTVEYGVSDYSPEEKDAA